MSQSIKNRLAIAFLGLLTIYILFIFIQSNLKKSYCTKLYSKCVVTNIKYLNLGSIDFQYNYWDGEKTVNVRWKISETDIKNLVSYIKAGDTLQLLY
jgi:hypothetical protein